VKGKYVLPFLALVGLAAALGTIIFGTANPPVSSPQIRSPQIPFASYVAGAGLIESRTQNIVIGAPVQGIVTAIYVQMGDWVKTGDPLFKIDDRDIAAQLPVAVAKAEEAEANLAKVKNRLRIGEGLTVGRSISEEDLANRRLDLTIAEAAQASTRAQVDYVKSEIERRTIRAPVPGRILKIDTRLGEIAQSTELITPLMVLGDDSQLHVRVDVNENDAWRVEAGAPAMAYVRGNPDLKTPLQFERIERYVLPKVSLTGDSTERTDMRVLQIIYSFDPASLPVYVGQQMDVYIQARPASPDTTSGPQRTTTGP